MGEDNNMNMVEHTFYEQTKYKLATSAFIACIGLMCLGFGLSFAGQSDAARIAAEDSNIALSSGYGLATLIFIVAFLIFVCAGIYLSPICCCGTAKESELVRSTLSGPNFNSGEGRPLPPVPATESTAEMPIESLYAGKSSAV